MSGINKWTVDNIINLCNINNIEFLGYNEDKRKINIKCKNGNITSPYLGSFVKKQNCSCEECGGNINWNKERIIKELNKYNYTYINHYAKNGKTHVETYCPNNNYYLITAMPRFGANGKKMCGCELCQGHKIWTDDAIREKVESLGYNYLGFEIKERYEKHIFMKCQNNNITDSIIPNLERRNWSCSCSDCIGKTTYSKENIIKALNENNYEYINHYYNNTGHLRVECICSKGNYYNTNWWNFVNIGIRCDCCKAKSKAEAKIIKEFDDRNIVYKHEYTSQDCKYIACLKFDFALFSDADKNNLLCLIEYDGIQHTQPVQYKGMTNEDASKAFTENQIRDNIKNEYCKNNSIPLLRIPHTIKYKELYSYIEINLLEKFNITL